MKYLVVSSLLSWIFPTKSDRNEFRNFCKKIDNRKNELKIKKRYEKIVAKIKGYDRNKKINVCFLCQDNAKWSYQSLYEYMEKSSYYNPVVLVSITQDLLKKKNRFLEYKKVLEDNYNFFSSRSMNVEYAFDIKKNKFIKLTKFEPDIVFYEQPWSLGREHSPEKVSEFALTCHCSYGSSIAKITHELTMPFYKYLWRFFLDNYSIQKKYLENNFQAISVPVCGQLKIDNYFKPLKNCPWKTKNKKRIIWAPHHSFFDESILKYGTFDWNYEYFYEFAKKHQEYEFVLKPHPVIYKEIVRKGLMSLEKMNEYFSSWKELPNAQIIEGGDYFDLFRTSDILITDCCSFLWEYLPTKKPVIHLINPKSIGYNEFGESLIKGYYPVLNVDEIEQKMKDLLVDEKDELLSVREQIIDKFGIGTQSTAERIIGYIEEGISRGE